MVRCQVSQSRGKGTIAWIWEVSRMAQQTEIKQTDEFIQALALLENAPHDVFITGRAGTGKSTLLTMYRDQCRHAPVVLAPTGVAALNVGGMTIHNFFGFPPNVTVEGIRSRTWVRRDRREIFKHLHTIIIDEVSMMRADLLDCIDALLRKHGPRRNARFGGVRMIFFGDLYQLPPVVQNSVRAMFQPGSVYESEFFFDAHVMRERDLEKTVGLEIFSLSRVFRQRSSRFLEILNRIRENRVREADLAVLNERVTAELSDIGDRPRVILTGTNKEADAINGARLDELGETTEIFASKTKVKGRIDHLKHAIVDELRYARGAQIMMNSNGPDLVWVNGSLGRIVAIAGDGAPVIRLESGRECMIEPLQRDIYEFALSDGQITSEVCGSYTQYPFNLCWAMTIHKSQGKTFDHVALSINRAFAPGQIYVALSRATALEGIELLTPIAASAIAVDPRIVAFSGTMGTMPTGPSFMA